MVKLLQPEATFCRVPACAELDRLDVIEGVAARARIVGACFVEYVPEQDPRGTGAQAIARLACKFIAAISGQRND